MFAAETAPQQVFMSTVKEGGLKDHVASRHSGVSCARQEVAVEPRRLLRANHHCPHVPHAPFLPPSQKEFAECFPDFEG